MVYNVVSHGDPMIARYIPALIAREQRLEEFHALGKRILDAVFHPGLRAIGNVEELITGIRPTEFKLHPTGLLADSLCYCPDPQYSETCQRL